VHHDHVVLSNHERAALADLVASMPAEDTWLAALLSDSGLSQKTEAKQRVAATARKRSHLLLVAVLVVSVVLAIGLAVTATGDLAWSGGLILAWGTLAGLCLIGGNGANAGKSAEWSVPPVSSRRSASVSGRGRWSRARCRGIR
jgi:hypothetical protein